MLYSVAILAFAAAATAAPFVAQTDAALCPAGLYSNPQCCATDVLNLADLDCDNPSTTPSDINSFISTCTAKGQQAKCCVIPVAGQALLCQDVNPSGGGGGGAAPTKSSGGGGSPGGSPTGAPGGGSPGGGAPAASSSPCTTSSAAVKPTKPAPAPPAATDDEDCGC